MPRDDLTEHGIDAPSSSGQGDQVIALPSSGTFLPALSGRVWNELSRTRTGSPRA